MAWIKNVLIETGREEIGKNNIITKTKRVSLLIEDGTIRDINDNDLENVEEYIDAKGYLALPSLSDNHIHLDKGHYGGNWKAVVPMSSVSERIIEEQEFLKDFLKDTPQKAQALIDLITKNGATFLRVHVNVDPTIELENLKIIKEVLENNKHKLDYEIVVFPQHGTLNTENKGLLTKALKDDKVIALGALDPATIDMDIEKSLKTTFDLAKEYNKEIDIHLHDRGTLGIYEINRIIDYTKKYDYQGKVQISHGLALADICDKELEKVAADLVECDIAINTTVPIDTKSLSVPSLKKYGVKINVVNDNINDHWSPFGTGDLIQRASRTAETFSMCDEVSLSQSLGLVTNGVTPLDENGNLIWPKIGDKADILFVKAESSAHLVGRICDDRVVLFNGKLVSGQFK